MDIKHTVVMYNTASAENTSFLVADIRQTTDDKNFDPVKALRLAADDWLRTDCGKRVLAAANRHFVALTMGDTLDVPNDICQKFGFLIADVTEVDRPEHMVDRMEPLFK